MHPTRAAAIQFNHRPGNKQANFETLSRLTKDAAGQGVKLAAFPEMCLTGYWHVRNLNESQVRELAEPVPDGEMTRALVDLAKEYEMTIGAGLIEESNDGTLYNTYVVAMPDGNTAHHRKLHCFINPHMKSGDQITVFDAPGIGRIGILICYDNNIGENARLCALAGAEVLLAPHQTGGCNSPSPLCMGTIDVNLWTERHENPERIEAEFRGPKGREWLLRWLPARAHDNGLFLIFSNGVGVDDDEVRTGNSMILGSYGEMLAETWAADEAIVVADLDPAIQATCTGRRWLKSRRPDLYGPLSQPTGIEEDTRKVRFEKMT